jgi:hypothetical protein
MPYPSTDARPRDVRPRRCPGLATVRDVFTVVSRAPEVCAGLIAIARLAVALRELPASPPPPAPLSKGIWSTPTGVLPDAGQPS